MKLAKDFDPAFKAGIEKKEDGVALLKDGIELLAEYQARLAAQDTYGVLVVLQALDAAGKDGTIRHVMSGVNPQGVRVESFKVPSARELDQDFLRRYQQRLPSRGEIGIFNRSHYEEVLVVRVHPENLLRQKLPAETREASRLETQVRSDQRLGALSVGERVPDRQALPEPLEGGAARCASFGASNSPITTGSSPRTTWRSAGTGIAYQEAFSEMFSHTSTAWAPWYVIPADRKWFARIAAAAVIAHALIDIDPKYPTPRRRRTP